LIYEENEEKEEIEENEEMKVRHVAEGSEVRMHSKSGIPIRA